MVKDQVFLSHFPERKNTPYIYININIYFNGLCTLNLEELKFFAPLRDEVGKNVWTCWLRRSVFDETEYEGNTYRQDANFSSNNNAFGGMILDQDLLESVGWS